LLAQALVEASKFRGWKPSPFRLGSLPHGFLDHAAKRPEEIVDVLGGCWNGGVHSIPAARITAVNANALEQYLVIAEAHA
jgi:hypothetical protein